MVDDADTGDSYAWTEAGDGPFALGATVTLVRNCSPERALEVLAPRRATPVAPAQVVRDWAEQQDYQNYGTAVEAGEIGGWTVVVEFNGYQATDRTLLEELSQDGEAVVIFRNVNAVSSFQYAKNGIIVREFDPLLPHMDQAGEPLPEEQGIAFPGKDGELHPMLGAFLLAERLTGIRLTESDVCEPGNRIAVGIHPR
jgi:hypothetical protein